MVSGFLAFPDKKSMKLRPVSGKVYVNGIDMVKVAAQ